MVRVELFGKARLLTGRRQVDLTVPENPDPGDVVVLLAHIWPQLVGHVIREDLGSLEASYTFNLNGTAFVGEEELHLTAGDTLLLFTSQAGG